MCTVTCVGNRTGPDYNVNSPVTDKKVTPTDLRCGDYHYYNYVFLLRFI